MTDILNKIQRVSSDLLPGRQIEVIARGEDYYAFQLENRQGRRSSLPAVWIDPKASDQQIREILSRQFRQAFDPDSDPDDLSVPNLQTEGE